MARDNFSKSVVDQLKQRVAFRCSNPECRAPTAAPSQDSDKAHLIGVAAHIHAASPGGPRYLTKMTQSERKAFDNGIWLCSNCSIKIDRDEKRYTADLLRGWKRQAEDAALRELGKRLPSEADAVNTLKTALTGLPHRTLSQAISNVHHAADLTLQELDPRFNVRTDFVNGAIIHHLLPRETVETTLQFKKSPKNYSNYKKLIDEGEPFRIRSEDFKFSGSALLEHIAQQEGTLTISPPTRPALLKIWLTEKGSLVTTGVDDINGHITWGKKILNFTGTCFDGLFKFELKRELNPRGKNGRILISLNRSAWKDKDIRTLPYFKKVHSFFYGLHKEHDFHLRLELNGESLIEAFSVLDSKAIDGTFTLLSYIDKARIIATHTDSNILLPEDIEFSDKEHQEISDIASRFLKKETYTAADLTKNSSVTLIVDKDKENLDSILGKDEPSNVQYIAQDRETVDIFGSAIALPPVEIKLSGVRPLVKVPLEEIKEGDHVEIEWIPTNDFICSIEYSEDSIPESIG